MHLTGEKWILLGASRGLGGEFAKQVLAKTSDIQLTLISRKIEQNTDSEFSVNRCEKITADFSKENEWDNLAQIIRSQQAHRIFYFAGGGPFGDYEQKAWKDHLWSYRLNFLFPAFLLQQALLWPGLRQIVFTGSAIAESNVDVRAASYCAGKHALKGLVTTVQTENIRKNSHLDLRLFSPGYMDTSLLPPDAWPRQHQGMVLPVDAVSEQLWTWIQNPNDANTHLIVPDKSLLK